MAIIEAAARPTGRALPAAWYHWLFLAATAWLVGGAFLDNWAHAHITTLDTFFTPWHGVLYSGYAACAAVLGVRWLREGSLPDGYGLSLAGCALFAVGGVADMVWHTFFGIERQLAAVLSPSHLWLIVAGGLIITGTVRAARAGAGRQAPPVAVLGAAVVFCYFGVTTEFAQPYLQRVAASTSQGMLPYNQAIQIGLFGVMLQSALLVGLLLKLRERFELPFGTVTVIVGLEALLVVTAASTIDFMVLVATLGGLAGDVAAAPAEPPRSVRLRSAGHAIRLLHPVPEAGLRDVVGGPRADRHRRGGRPDRLAGQPPDEASAGGLAGDVSARQGGYAHPRQINSRRRRPDRRVVTAHHTIAAVICCFKFETGFARDD